MDMFFLSYVNETMYLLWNLPFFKMVSPKTNFFLFSNLGLLIAQKTSIHINWLGDDTPHAVLSQKCILWEKSLVKETPSASRCLSYLINNFLMNIKQLAKSSTESFSIPF